MNGNKHYAGPTYSGPIDTSATTPVQNLPTATVLRGGALVDASGASVINIVGAFSVVIDAGTLVNGQSLLLLATGGVAASVSLSNGGTIAGEETYVLRPGNFLSVSFDGTNLVE